MKFSSSREIFNVGSRSGLDIEDSDVESRDISDSINYVNNNSTAYESTDDFNLSHPSDPYPEKPKLTGKLSKSPVAQKVHKHWKIYAIITFIVIVLLIIGISVGVVFANKSSDDSSTSAVGSQCGSMECHKDAECNGDLECVCKINYIGDGQSCIYKDLLEDDQPLQVTSPPLPTRTTVTAPYTNVSESIGYTTLIIVPTRATSVAPDITTSTPSDTYTTAMTISTVVATTDIITAVTTATTAATTATPTPTSTIVPTTTSTTTTTTAITTSTTTSTTTMTTTTTTTTTGGTISATTSTAILSTATVTEDICSLCHEEANCINGQECECDGDLIGDGINSCHCSDGFERVGYGLCRDKCDSW
eukprot:Awhi_evm1s4014